MFAQKRLRNAFIVTGTLLAGAMFVLSTVAAPAGKSGTSNTFSVTGSMNVPRFDHRAILLGTGEVLVVTGDATGANTAELYNPATGKWTLTGSPAEFHEGGSVTLLRNGQVLLAGGGNPNGTPVTAGAELYSPATGQWNTTGNLISARRHHVAVLLGSGQVLVAGGEDPNLTSESSAELYNPGTGAWQATNSMHDSRVSPAAQLLGTGSVLVAGGSQSSNGTVTSLVTAETFNPSSAEWTSIANMPAQGSLSSFLANGDVLVVRPAYFTPATQSWTATGPFTKDLIGPTTATLLGTGEVLLTGLRSAYNPDPPLVNTFLYNFGANAYRPASSMNAARYENTATLLPTGQVLITGGYNLVSGHLSSAELYNP